MVLVILAEPTTVILLGEETKLAEDHIQRLMLTRVVLEINTMLEGGKRRIFLH